MDTSVEELFGDDDGDTCESCEEHVDDCECNHEDDMEDDEDGGEA